MIVENIVLVLGTTIHFNLQTIPSLFVIGQKTVTTKLRSIFYPNL